MKKLFPFAAIAVFAALTFSSCKKDYTCTCTAKVKIDTTEVDSSQSFSLGKESKSDAQSACDNYQKNETATEDSFLLLAGIPDSDGTVICHL